MITPELIRFEGGAILPISD